LNESSSTLELESQEFPPGREFLVEPERDFEVLKAAHGFGRSRELIGADVTRQGHPTKADQHSFQAWGDRHFSLGL
jgi:hypothetical protein